MEDKKCLLVSNMYPGEKSVSYGIFVKNIIEGLEKSGMKFDKVVISGRGNSICSKLLKYLKFYFKLLFRTLLKKYKLVYVHYLNYSSLPLQLVVRLRNIKLVINLHGSDILPKTRLGRILLAVNSNLLKKAILIVVPSAYYRDILLRHYPIDETKIFVSPSGGVDCQLFQPLELARNEDIICIGYVSRIDEGKGWEILLSAVEEIYVHGNNCFRLIVVGDGAQSTKFQSMLKSLACRENIEYLGNIQQHELVNVYNQMDVFVFPSYRESESLGLVGLEAMSCGVPVIGSKIGGLTEYIKHGLNGYFFESKNINALVSKINQFISLDTTDRDRMKYNARETALRFGRTKVTDQLYRRLNAL